jgi:hypothetical protein
VHWRKIKLLSSRTLALNMVVKKGLIEKQKPEERKDLRKATEERTNAECPR